MGVGIGLRIASRALAFRPDLILGLQAWYRGDLTLVTGSLVDQWTDKSGNARHLSAAGAARPTLVASALNSQPGLQFSGAQELKTVATFSLSTVSIFVVFRASGTAGVVVDHAPSLFSGQETLLYGSQGPTSGITRGSGASYKNRAANWSTDGVNRIVRQQFGGTHASNKVFFNGTEQSLTDSTSTADPGTAASTPAAALHVGAANGVTLPLTGYVMELLVYSPVLSAVDAQRLEQLYLGPRYGLTVA